MYKRREPGPGPRPNTRPADDIGDCPAVSPEGYLCTRNRNHLGNHDAEGLNSISLMNWSDSETIPEAVDR